MGTKAKKILEEKAYQSQLCYESLKKHIGFEEVVPTSFCVNKKRYSQMKKACFKKLSFPKYRPVLCYLRLKAVRKLFKEENILQTPAMSAAITACNSIALNIGKIRGMQFKEEDKAYCDIAFAGFQAIRLYMPSYNDEKFSMQRFNSCFGVNNAFNGSFYKYETKDGRKFSYHVYYESQKEKLTKALKIEKDAKDFTMSSSKNDRIIVREETLKHNGLELEDLAFECGATGCVIRNRDEWEKTEVGKAVCEMPLFITKKKNDTEKKEYGLCGKTGPLSGIKVLDLTHIIAGPACTRILAEYGADVLLVRRKDFYHQEQSFLELDGWAGKNAIDLDLNKKEHLDRIKELIKEADIIVYSYQRGSFDKFGLSEKEIHKLNPNVIYGNLMCFSDTVWENRPGWAPLAEDITGLSIRNGTQEEPKNLNGVPLDYLPGTILALGVLDAIKKSITEGGSYTVTTSLTRGAQWLHECTDFCEKPFEGKLSTTIEYNKDFPIWEKVRTVVGNNAVGEVGFPTPAIINTSQENIEENMRFTQDNKGFKEQKK